MFRVKFVGAAIISVLFLAPGGAWARGSFYIGIGTSVGHCHSSFGHSLVAHHGFHSGCYDLWGHGHYYGMGSAWHRTYFPSWHSCWSGASIYIDDCWPVYVRPRVVEKRRVVNVVVREPRTVEYKPSYEPPDAKLVEKVRNKKNELLRVLKIGDKASRMKAIGDLVGYSFDAKVGKALEEVILTDPDPDLRRQVAESLGKVKNMNLITTLEKVRLEDEDMQVREAAGKAIEKIKSY